MFNRTGTRQAKYRNKKCEYMGLKFDSQIERDRYIFLKDQKLVCHLETQHELKIEVNAIPICKYIADFSYILPDGSHIFEDVKGFAITADFVLKKKLLKAIHGIDVQIVTKATAPVGIQPPKPKKSKTAKKGKLKL